MDLRLVGRSGEAAPDLEDRLGPPLVASVRELARSPAKRLRAFGPEHGRVELSLVNELETADERGEPAERLLLLEATARPLHLPRLDPREPARPLRAPGARLEKRANGLWKGVLAHRHVRRDGPFARDPPDDGTLHRASAAGERGRERDEDHERSERAGKRDHAGEHRGQCTRPHSGHYLSGARRTAAPERSSSSEHKRKKARRGVSAGPRFTFSSRAPRARATVGCGDSDPAVVRAPGVGRVLCRSASPAPKPSLVRRLLLDPDRDDEARDGTEAARFLLSVRFAFGVPAVVGASPSTLDLLHVRVLLHDRQRPRSDDRLALLQDDRAPGLELDLARDLHLTRFDAGDRAAVLVRVGVGPAGRVGAGVVPVVDYVLVVVGRAAVRLRVVRPSRRPTSGQVASSSASRDSVLVTVRRGA